MLCLSVMLSFATAEAQYLQHRRKAFRAAIGGDIALVSNVSVGSPGGNSVTTGSITTTGATLLVAVLTDYDAFSAGAISDSKGNTWTTLTTSNNVSRCRIAYVANPTVGTGHTFTSTQSGEFQPALCVAAFSGVVTTSPFDQQNGTTFSGATTSSPGSVTPSAANELLIAGIGFDSSNTVSIGSGFTITNQVNSVPDAHIGAALAYKIQTSATAENPAWSWSSSSNGAVRIATFKD